MGIKLLFVDLSPRLLIYFPGQLLEGIVKVDVEKSTVCKGITLTCFGEAWTEWKKRSMMGKRYFYNGEVYGKQKMCLWGEEGSRNLASGIHEFPFSFVLPEEMPSSFEGPYGFVRYKVKAKAKVPHGLDKRCQVYFSFCQPYDLNLDFRAQTPLSVVSRKDQAWSVKSQVQVTMELEGPTRAYVPGATVNLRARIKNDESSTIEFKTAMKQKVAYHSKRRHRMEHSRNVWKGQTRSCLPHEESGWFEISFQIPAVVPNLKFCNIIDVEYVFQMKTKMKMNRDVEISQPFILGTVPFKAEAPTYEEAAVSDGTFPSHPPATLSPQAVSPCHFCTSLSSKSKQRLKGTNPAPNYVILPNPDYI
ncbi:arrestin domain-containing protein 17-like [Hyalella azteca]|uniref:Arrestin domain-containing protein 17-like n=1 Tax=Hyalella azteca TaxID=294128 RepID=A0A979FK75_HYAAZ|nr:arrestin domain-containing protein 17-like [Hyalella azteca]